MTGNIKTYIVCISLVVCTSLAACATRDGADFKVRAAVRQSYVAEKNYTDVVNAINDKMLLCRPFVFQHHEVIAFPDENKSEIQFLSEYYTPKLLVSVESAGDTSSRVDVFAVSDRPQCIAAIESVRRAAYGEPGCP
jgi:hypothetical protein